MSDTLMVGKSIISMICNALQRDADEGKTIRKEMLDALKQSINELNPSTEYPNVSDGMYYDTLKQEIEDFISRMESINVHPTEKMIIAHIRENAWTKKQIKKVLKNHFYSRFCTE